jgi:hypothetical protein
MSSQLDKLTLALRRVLVEELHQKSPEWHPTIEELAAYHKGEVSAEFKEGLRDHLVICPGCSDLLLACGNSSDLQAEFDLFLNPGQDDPIALESESQIKEAWRQLNEADLMQRVRERMPRDVEARYKILAKKRDSQSLTPSEYEELLGLSERIEQFEVQRLEALARLARLRSLPLKTLIEELGLKPTSNA